MFLKPFKSPDKKEFLWASRKNQVCAENTLAIVIPYHRVVRKNGTLSELRKLVNIFLIFYLIFITYRVIYMNFSPMILSGFSSAPQYTPPML